MDNPKSNHHDPETAPVDDQPEKKKETTSRSLFLWTRDIAICLILVLLFRANVAEANYIPSQSMEPTLHIQDRIIVDKLSMNWRPLERGELVIFHPPIESRENERWIKRVIGLPGDTVEVIRGIVYINGDPLDEPYVQNRAYYTRPPMVLWEDNPDTEEDESEYYLLGDNRPDSQDSHVWGTCRGERIIGRAVYRYWPIGSMGSLTDSDGRSEPTE